MSLLHIWWRWNFLTLNLFQWIYEPKRQVDIDVILKIFCLKFFHTNNGSNGQMDLCDIRGELLKKCWKCTKNTIWQNQINLDWREAKKLKIMKVFTHILLDTELESSILDYIDAVVIVSWPEQTFAFLQLNKHHVATKLQEQGFLKMTQDPTASCRTKI